VTRVPDFAAFFDGRDLAGDYWAGSAGPDHLLEEAEDEAGGAGDHQDYADGVYGDALDMEVGGELEDRAYGYEEDACSDGHGR
jgi:hypothetical protein